ncbi:hypothetical protein [Halospeciosus flavus]|uniref:Uncharacterized protein n=1 Tax=Halospeciosus flavus TaxID=3032283 RepID=A0ABD5Z4P4_9EURY|nr:hypothetical protein [Halospeciosus flavus]
MAAIDTEHPSWRVAAGTFVSYGILLAVVTVLLFLVPYAVFAFGL